MCIYIFNMYTYIPCAYIYVWYIHIYVRSALDYRRSGKPPLHFEACRLNLHVAHYGEASSLPGATISYFQFTSALKKGPWGMSLSISLSPGIMGARKTTFEKDGCFHQGWGSWDRMMMARRQLWERLCSWAWWGRNLALVEVGLHNLLQFLSWNVVIS